MGRVPQLWSCMGRRPYTGLEAEQFPSGFEAAASRLSWNADKKVKFGPEKEAPAICGAFVRHPPRFHKIVVVVESFLSVSMQCGGQETRDNVSEAIMRPLSSDLRSVSPPKMLSNLKSNNFMILQQKYLTYELPTKISGIRT